MLNELLLLHSARKGPQRDLVPRRRQDVRLVAAHRLTVSSEAVVSESVGQYGPGEGLGACVVADREADRLARERELFRPRIVHVCADIESAAVVARRARGGSPSPDDGAVGKRRAGDGTGDGRVGCRLTVALSAGDATDAAGHCYVGGPTVGDGGGRY